MPFLPRAIGRWEILPNLRGKKTLQPGADGFIIEKKWEELSHAIPDKPADFIKCTLRHIVLPQGMIIFYPT